VTLFVKRSDGSAASALEAAANTTKVVAMMDAIDLRGLFVVMCIAISRLVDE
jgi:hypothetical protein